MRSMSELLKLFEAELDRKEIGKLFTTAQDSRKNSIFKKEISANDLTHLWKEARFPTDVRDIVAILKSAKFSPKEINKVFKQAGYGSADTPAISPAMSRLSKYIIAQDYTDDILTFLTDNYEDIDEMYVADGNIVVEDIRTIFNEIVKEDRPKLVDHLKKEQVKNMGRNKK